jgi:hypothetical protein
LAFPSLPIENPDSFKRAFPAVDSKADTLTQSQLFKDLNSNKFIQGQLPEIKGLQNMDVFTFKPMSTKPAHTKLFSSIWSYKQKRSLIGTILKYKA